MDTLSAIKARRAIKHFDPKHTMPEDDRRTILEHALLSPTSFNIQHWRVLDVQDAELRAELRAAAWDQAQITDASMLVIITGDVQAWQNEPARYWQDAPQEISQMLLPMIQEFHENNQPLQRDEAIRSSGIMAQTIMLAAKALGYDSCPMIGFDADMVGKLIHLPDDYVIGLMIAIGKPLKPANPRSGQLPYNEVIIKDHF